MKNLEHELKQLGLSDKEAAVYIASLALGPSTVQVISRKAKTARATTYLLLDALIKRGLVTQFHEDKKTLFVAESPANLSLFVSQEEERVALKKDQLNALLPKLLAIAKDGTGYPVVRYYEGLEALKTLRQEMTAYTPVKGTWHTLMQMDALLTVFGDDFLYKRPRTARGIKSKTIFTTRSKALKEKLLATAKQDFTERKYISPKDYPDNDGYIIFEDRIIIVVFTINPHAVVIESKEIANFFRTIFNLIWKSLP